MGKRNGDKKYQHLLIYICTLPNTSSGAKANCRGLLGLDCEQKEWMENFTALCEAASRGKVPGAAREV